MTPGKRLLFLAAILLPLAACGSGRDGSAVEIAAFGDPQSPFEKGLRLSHPAQLVRAATAAGLVRFDAQGEVVPGLAERWIVTDDGLSYIFRLRDSDWPDGSEISARSVRDALKQAIRSLDGTSLGLDLAPVADVRAMTGRVIEIRLNSAQPDFLQLLAQPELGLLHKGRGTGPMRLTREGDVALLEALPPEQRGLPKQADWADAVRALHLRALPAATAAKAFDDGAVDIVLGGRLAQLPLADTGPLSRGTVRLDAAQGLFGLIVARADGVLADAARREALSMALDRDQLLGAFNIAGWTPTSRIVAPGLPADPGTIGERWSELSLDQRRAEAARRIAAWSHANGKPATVKVRLAPGPGSDLLFTELAKQWAAIGVRALRAGKSDRADLLQLDADARLRDPRWFLDQFACVLGRGLCSAEADKLVRDSAHEPDPIARAAMLSEAEADLTAVNGYIPFGAPVRWSLVRGDIEGFSENTWALHPLFPLSRAPI
jgi:ABC-type transport system substrate-binding protein